MPGSTVAEFMKDSVSVRLLHLGMNVVTGISQLGDFLGKKLHTIDRVAKNDTLVDLKLGEQGVQAVYLLPFFDVGIELGDTSQCEFIH